MRRVGRSRGNALAVLLLGLLVLAALQTALGTATKAGASAMMTTTRNDGGLGLSISVPRWRFFRDELVPVTLVLTNRSGAPIQYMGQSGSAFAMLCYGSPLSVAMSWNGQYISPRSIMGVWPICRVPLHPFATLRAGAVLRLVVPLALPVSGRLALTAQALFAPGQRVQSAGLVPASSILGGLRHLFPALFRSAHAPFAAGWPGLTIAVSPHIPSARTLRLVRRGHSVVVRGDVHALRRLMVQESSEWVTPQGACASGAPLWSSLPGTIVRDLMNCDSGEPHEKWQVLVGAPGYAVIGAVYCFDPIPSMTFGGTAGFPHETQPPCTERIVAPHVAS